MTALRVAVVGTGRMSGTWLPLLRDRPDVEVVAFAEPDEAAARAAASSHGLSAPIFRDLETAAQAAAPEVVVNLTPPELHRPIVETALQLGCHVLGEKPIATTLEDAQALVRAATAAGRTYAVMQNRRFEHGIRTLRDGLAEGRIGSVTMLACDFFKAPHFGGFRDEMESPLLVDMAIHHFDQARFLAGVDPVAVSCHEFNPAGSWYRGNATAVCMFEFPDGLVFSYRGSWSAEGFGTSWNGSWRVVGTAGTVLWDGEVGPVSEVGRLPDRDEEPDLLYPIERAGWERTWRGRTGHAGCLDEMLAALADGRRPETDASDNVKSLAMVLAALASAREGRRVELEDAGVNIIR